MAHVPRMLKSDWSVFEEYQKIMSTLKAVNALASDFQAVHGCNVIFHNYTVKPVLNSQSQ